MKTGVKVALVTVILGVAAIVLGPIIWPVAQGGAQPTAGQLVFFVILEVIQSLAFGLGVAFLLFGFSAVRRASPNSGLVAWAMYLSIGWLLVSWWPHAHLHQVVGENLQALLYIEYGFHVTAIIAGLVLAYGFVSLYVSRARLRLAWHKRTPRLRPGRGLAASALLLALIQRSAWNKNSRKFSLGIRSVVASGG